MKTVALVAAIMAHMPHHGGCWKRAAGTPDGSCCDSYKWNPADNKLTEACTKCIWL